MSVRFLLVLLPLVAIAQPALTLTASAPGYPGTTVTINVVLSGSATAPISAIQWDGIPGTTRPVLGPASTAAHKAMFIVTGSGPGTNGTPPATQVLLAGTTGPPGPVVPNLPYADGIVATFTYPIPAVAAMGTAITLTMNNAVAGTTNIIQAGGNVASAVANVDIIPLGVPSITITAGIAPSCMAALSAMATTYQKNPSQLAMLLAQLMLQAANITGSCQ